MSTRFDAYAAGLVDGEGCITAKATKSKTGMGIRVLIGMATKASSVLNRMQAEYSGTLITQQPSNPKHSEVMTWTVTGSEAARFLDRILPHLILKVEQAQLALKIEEIRTSLPQIGSRDHHKWTPEATERCRVLYRRIMELNERGAVAESPKPVNGREIARLVAGTWVTEQADLYSDLGWEPFSGTWPRSGCMSDGRAYELPTSAPRITANVFSSWLPTPSASDHKKVDNETEWTRNSPGLPAVSIHFPTLTVGNATGTNERRGGARSDEKLLPGIVLDFLPTPKANDFRDNNSPSESRRKDPALTAVSVYFPESTGVTTDPLFAVGNE